MFISTANISRAGARWMAKGGAGPTDRGPVHEVTLDIFLLESHSDDSKEMEKKIPTKSWKITTKIQKRTRKFINKLADACCH